jgi:hypothetical protein
VIDSPEIEQTNADIAERVPDTGPAAVARAYAEIIGGVNKVDRKDLQTAPLWGWARESHSR